MEVYKFKCKCCGSTRYKKPTKNIYQCLYCGEEIEVYHKSDDEKPTEDTTEQVQATESNNVVTKSDNFQKNTTQQEEAKLETKNIVIFIICLMFGWLGIHRFLQGKIISGIFYAVTGGIFGVGIFIDAILLGIESIKDIKKYLKEKENAKD